MPTEAPFLALDQVTYAYPGEGPTVAQADLALAPGDFHCLVGRSGCGKTTLLKLAAGLLLPSAGRVCIEGRPLAGPSRLVGFVFQTPSLLEWRTVLDNVLLPISLHRRVTVAERDRAADLLALMGIGDYAHRHPHQLSGGQQSRAALARALVTEPPALLMDEPFAALDAITREELQDDLLRLVGARRATVLFVTHDIAEAAYLASHVSVMEGGRIGQTFGIAGADRQGTERRYDPRFTRLCRDIRAALALPAGAAA